MQPGDLMVLATDALAAWFLRQAEAGEQPWQELAGFTLGLVTLEEPPKRGVGSCPRRGVRPPPTERGG